MKSRLLIGALVLGLAALVLTRPPQEKQAHAQAGSGGTGIPLANGWNLGAVTSGSAVFGSNLVPKNAASVLRIAICLSASAQVSMKETDGSHTFTSFLNGGTALSANTLYTFVWEARCSTAPGGVTGPTGFNFVLNGPASVNILRVTEVTSGVD